MVFVAWYPSLLHPNFHCPYERPFLIGPIKGEAYDDPESVLTEDDWKQFLTQGAWSAFPPMNCRRSNHAVCLVDDKHRPAGPLEAIVAVGGWGNEHTTEMYDPELGRWVVLPCRTNAPRKFHAMAAVDVKWDKEWDDLFAEERKMRQDEAEQQRKKRETRERRKSSRGRANKKHRKQPAADPQQEGAEGRSC